MKVASKTGKTHSRLPDSDFRWLASLASTRNQKARGTLTAMATG
jgi:hypothetical protein